MKKQYEVTRQDMVRCTEELLNLPVRVLIFRGTLGVGKTTLVQETLALLGIKGPIQSPTYTYVSVYPLPDGRVVYHFDLYRLSSYQEFVQAGFDEYLYDEQSLCFIEWPDIITHALPQETISIMLDYLSEEKRLITIE